MCIILLITDYNNYVNINKQRSGTFSVYRHTAANRKLTTNGPNRIVQKWAGIPPTLLLPHVAGREKGVKVLAKFSNIHIGGSYELQQLVQSLLDHEEAGPAEAQTRTRNVHFLIKEPEK